MLLRLVALILVLFTASAAHAQSSSESFSIVVTRADGPQECRPACAGATVVAATGAGIEWLGHASRGAIKEWTGWGAVAFGVAQVVGLGLLVNRPVRSH